jgi:serine/threonine-protein kinase
MIHSEPKKRPQTTTEVLNFIQKETSSSQQTNLLFKPNQPILNNSPPSINLQAQSINIENMTISPDRLSINLAQAIGPIAKILIKKAQAQTSDPMQLVQSLAKHISSEQQRQQFIKQSGISFPPKEAKNISINHEKNKESHSVTAITQDGLSHAINCLSYYLGPISKILVNKIAQTVDSQEELLTQLADELDNDEHRKDFIKRMKA